MDGWLSKQLKGNTLFTISYGTHAFVLQRVLGYCFLWSRCVGSPMASREEQQEGEELEIQHSK